MNYTKYLILISVMLFSVACKTYQYPLTKHREYDFLEKEE